MSYSKVHVYTCTVLTIPMWLSICMILLFAPYSYNFERTSFSTPNTTPSFPLMPTIVLWRNTEQSIYFLWVLLFQSLLLHTSHACRFLKVIYILLIFPVRGMTKLGGYEVVYQSKLLKFPDKIPRFLDLIQFPWFQKMFVVLHT